MSAATVVFLAHDPLGPSLTGPARRTVKLAEVVAEHCSVTLAAPCPSVFPGEPFRGIETGPPEDQRLGPALAGHDVVVVPTLRSPRQLLAARRHARRLVVDMTAPLALELLEIEAGGPAREAVVRWRTRQMLDHLAIADLLVCSNERQRDLLVGAALAAGVLEPGANGAPMNVSIAVVPHGLDGIAPPRGRSQLRTGALAGENDRIAVWGGGTWSWLDPVTAIAAVERLRPSRPDLKLAFVGLDHPDPVQRRSHEPVATAARAYVRDHGLEDAVVFRPEWLPREAYLEHLADADAGVSLHRPTLEGRYASRTRILDYLEAGLPVVCSAGDTMSDVVAQHGLGHVVAPGDVDACAAALDAATASPRREGSALESLLWRNVARPLVEFCVSRPEPAPWSRREALLLAAREYPPFLRAVRRTERGGVARAAGRRVAGVVRRSATGRPR